MRVSEKIRIMTGDTLIGMSLKAGVDKQVLRKWHNKKDKKFDLVINGCIKPLLKVKKGTLIEMIHYAGLPSIAELSRISGVSRETLYRWHESEKKRKLFIALLRGARKWKLEN